MTGMLPVRILVIKWDCTYCASVCVHMCVFARVNILPKQRVTETALCACTSISLWAVCVKTANKNKIMKNL